MTLIDVADLAQIRADQLTARPDYCTRTRYTFVADGYGGHTTTSATAQYTCRVRPMVNIPRELVEAGKITGTALFIVSLPYTADVIPSDILTHNSRTLQVLGVYRDPTWDTVLRAYCQEKQ